MAPPESPGPSHGSPSDAAHSPPESDVNVRSRHEEEQRTLQARIEAAERRKLHARESANRTVWFGLGMFGLVGWSVAIPALIGVAIGLWLDSQYPSRLSWTLMLLIAGMALGCWNAWQWLHREGRIDR